MSKTRLVPRRPFTELELNRALALGKCRFRPPLFPSGSPATFPPTPLRGSASPINKPPAWRGNVGLTADNCRATWSHAAFNSPCRLLADFMAAITIYKSLEQAINSIPACPRPCYLCAPHGHHWYLWFPEMEMDAGDPGQPEEPDDEDDWEAITDPQRHTPDQEEPENAQACICKHCPVKVYVSIDADDLPEI
jgi:hypothetical protein